MMENKMNNIARYILADETVQPQFEYFVITGSSYVDYYLFTEDELEEAIAQLKSEYNKGHHTARICVPHFCCNDRTWRLEEFMSLDCRGKVYFERYGDGLLHVKFYMDAGVWLNPREIE